MQIFLANPRGFCAGVQRAIEIVERAIKMHGAPVYVRHDVVHNQLVVDELRAKGAVFVDDIEQIPPGSTVIFSAHGVSKAVHDDAVSRKLNILDATCPLVTKVHIEVMKMRAQGKEVILIGHRGHPEVEGTLGQCNDGIYLVENEDDIASLHVKDPKQLAFVTQTTLSIDDARKTISALRLRFPNIVGPKKDDICYATQNRQDAVKSLAKQCDLIVVVGSPASSNANRLREVAEALGITAYMVGNAGELQMDWFVGKQNIGVISGASTPESLVKEIVSHIRTHISNITVTELAGVIESVTFPLPKELSATPENRLS